MNLTRGFRLPNTNKGITVRYSDNSKNKTDGGAMGGGNNIKKDDRQQRPGG